jgi:squalene-hopene/tetraprenyl-beta-curcumene cyclase
MTSTSAPHDTLAASPLSDALGRGVDALLRAQDGDGWWKGILDTNVTMDAEDLLLRQFLGVLDPTEAQQTAAWIRAQQRDDGTWATFCGGPPDLSTTVEAYVALRLAGDPSDAAHMRAAAGFIIDAGGVERVRVFTKVWLSLFGLWSWDDLPAVPPEVVLLPRWFPLNIYNFACWARQTIVPLTIVAAHRPVRPVAFDIDELRCGPDGVPTPGAGGWRGTMFGLLDRALHAYERRPLRRVRAIALRKAEAWIVHRQEADGSWGGIQPPWVYSMMALQLQGYSLDHPVLRAGFEGLDRFTVHEDGTRRLEACQSPVWDTALAVIALADAGLAPEHPALVRAGRWLLDKEIRIAGDWAVRRPRLAPAGWAFEFHNDHYADIDDTSEVVLALARIDRAAAGDGLAAAIDRGVEWVVGMQCRDGGWGAFDVDNTHTLARGLPFCDFGEVIDPPSADVTAHVVEMLAALDVEPHVRRRGIDWLFAAQEADGSWFGRWGANYVYGTGHVLAALAAAGLTLDDRRIRRAQDWLRTHQNPDGGWGEDLRSYRDPTLAGRGASTPSQTAWALLGLLALGEHDEHVRDGIAHLIDAQRDDGTWDEALYTGTGFPGDFYINYHLYRQVFPLMALGRFAAGHADG